ncbi:MAG TPA: ATP-binding protein [Gemmatimonadales bacterium]|nr:ATP-binding protein [Gemmatimonadales bacterium]
MRSLVVIAAALAAPSGVARGQVAPPPVAFAVSAWTTSEGIPQSSISSLALDDEGYLWLGTYLGVSRFDGDTFVTYARSPTVAAPEPATALVRDRGIWLSWPSVGIGRMLPGGPARVPADALTPLFHLAIGPSDTVWVGTVAGVRRLDGGHWLPIDGLPDSIVGPLRVLEMDARGVLWIGGARGVVRLVPGHPRTVQRARIACAEVFDVAPTRDGGAWIATCAGIERLFSDGRPSQVVVPRLGGRPPLLVWPDERDSVLWVADDAGARRLRVARDARGAWEVRRTFAHSLDLGGASPNAMIGDGAGGVWVGTSGAGLRHVRRLAVRRVTLADGLPARPVHHLASDGADGLWIGNCGGLARWRDGAVAVVNPSAFGLLTPCIQGLLREPAGALWIGQLNALIRVDADGRSRVMLRSVAQPDRELYPMLRDRRGRVWFASALGEVGYFAAPDSDAVMLPATALPAVKVASMAEDEAGGIWVGQTGLVSRFEDTTRTLQLTTAEGVPAAPIRALVFDADTVLWMASYGAGLANYDADHGVRRLRPRGRQFDQLLSAIHIDRHDRLWLLGDGGIMGMPRREAHAAIAAGRPALGIVDIGAEQGLPEGNGGFPNTWFDAAAERWWVATVDGVASVTMAAAPYEMRPLHVRIDDVRFDGTSAGTPDTARVPASVNALEFRFSSPLFGATELARLRYRLRDHDRDWLDAGDARVARYASVAPGRYVFEVRIVRNFGAPEEASQSIPVLVQPRWWETPTARALALALGVALVWAVFQWLTRRIRERNRALQREMAERERAERQAADAARELAHLSRLATAGELATSIAHELNQPLAAVMGSAQQARRLAAMGEQEQLRPTLDAIVDQSERAADVIRSLRAFVLKQQSWDPDVALEDVVADTVRLLRQELSGRSVAVEFHDDRGKRAAVQGSAVQLQQVLANLLLNAADAMAELPPARRRATIRIRNEDEGSVRLSVADTGPGIPPAVLPELFQSFFTTKPDGLGLGLSLSRSIIEAHAGRLWAECPPEGGSVFHIVLPLAQP